MKKLWPIVTKDNPCPVCGKVDWCALGDRAVKCMRVPSEHLANDGGWYHGYNGAYKPKYIAPKRDIAKPLEGVENTICRWRQSTNIERLEKFALMLGVTCGALIDLRVCWSACNNAWAFPMRNEIGTMVGIRLRNERGDKWAVKGSQQGLFIPFAQLPQKTVFIVEGPTDTAAGIDMGMFIIGRPSANSGVDLVRGWIRYNKIARAVIISDNDQKKQPNGVEYYPGLQGATALGKRLSVPYAIMVPPAKDLREFKNLGGDFNVINCMAKSLVWKT